MKYLADLFGRTGLVDATSIFYLKNSISVFLLSVICCLPLGNWLHLSSGSPAYLYVKEVLTNILLIFILVAAISFSISGGYSPFIYFNF